MPAWRLWNQPTILKPDARAWMMLGIASLAALATSPVPYARVVRVVAENQIIYARITYASPSYKTMQTVFSQDGGRTWQEARSAPSELARDVTLPRVVCESTKPEVGYRIGLSRFLYWTRAQTAVL